MFVIPVKELIVNDPTSQVKLITTDGDEVVEINEFDGEIDRIDIVGFHNFARKDLVEIPDASGNLVRMLVSDSAAGTKQVNTFTVTAATATEKKVYNLRLVFGSSDRERVEYQEVDKEQRFQMTILATETATQQAAQLVKEINGNPNLPVTATSAAAVVTITAKESGIYFNLYCEELGTNAVTTPVVLEQLTYNVLKNKQWPVNVELDRNLEYFPVKGATYKSYYFETTADMSHIGGQISANQQVTTKNGFRLYVNKVSAAALITQLDLLVTASAGAHEAGTGVDGA
jgi:phage tail sheath gpL-like